ncbi:hypothetical protein [Bacillus thuringiensis]|uniref:hypothetical protein n=1 Tax=Bacillus thuringiensis TaxID=1428 RepID=UPI0018DBD20B|nr:hypothetical protein [Bacillus thuringiensis]
MKKLISTLVLSACFTVSPLIVSANSTEIQKIMQFLQNHLLVPFWLKVKNYMVKLLHWT